MLSMNESVCILITDVNAAKVHILADDTASHGYDK